MSKTEAITTKRHVKASIRDAIYTSLNIGMAESYFCAFMLALGISEITAGQGTVMAQFIGVVFQLLSIRTFFRKYSLKTRLLIFLACQAGIFIPLLLIGAFKIKQSHLVIGVLGLYWASALSLNPPWNKLMGHTIPQRFRIKFFSIRNQFGQAAILTGLAISGFALYFARQKNAELTVFLMIFLAGFCLKALSWFEIKNSHRDHIIAHGIESRLPMREFIKRLRKTEQGKLISFLFFFYVTVHFASPYFAPYMLGTLKFNYIEYMLVGALSYTGRVFIFKVLQRRAKGQHINRLLIFSTLGISTSPLMWALTDKFGFILAIEFLSGCYWGAFELSTILLYYQKVEDHERTSVMSYITFFNVTGMVVGSLLGATFLRHLPSGYDKYISLFIAATLIRACAILFAPHVNFKGQIPKLISFNRVFMVLPPFGALSRPIFDRIKKKKEEVKEVAQEKK